MSPQLSLCSFDLGYRIFHRRHAKMHFPSLTIAAVSYTAKNLLFMF